MTSITEIKDAMPAYAKDLKLNLSSMANNPGMTDQQVYGTALACAFASRNAKLIKAVAAEAKAKLSEEAIEAAKGAAAIMGMNNIYYRFVHLVSDAEYGSMPARLRMNIIGKRALIKPISSCSRLQFQRSMAVACASIPTTRCLKVPALKRKPSRTQSVLLL